ncbi:transient receptor potential channel pyrexia-like [Leguminivora glycinivorella]|uniref:transient receptor potential channel pyrexia-like n=1 Tax=Leguminivora glycinivorella TaxID=1035111 RepID=UPI00200C6534|nr:transient receptor potential channel pyrexia-like [Leguminivora glycinivorella]XP_048000603.1 transient receptor potential channel pyrexia-like [Leguminivora glycinivorella]
MSTAQYNEHETVESSAEMAPLNRLPPDIAPPCHPRTYSWWPLHEAVQDRNTSKVKQLLAEGVLLTSRDRNKKTPLHLCTELYSERSDKWPNEKIILCEIISAVNRAKNKEAILENLDEKSRTPLYAAINNENIEVVKILVKGGASVDKISGTEETALHAAAQHPNMLKYFLDLNIIKNSPTLDGKIAIHYATTCNEVESVRLLLEKFGREQLMIGDCTGSTVYHIAALVDAHEIMELIDVYYKPHVDINGETPLNISAKRGNKAVTASLLKHGAALSDRGHLGITVVNQIARHFDNPVKFFDNIFNEFINFEITDLHPLMKEKRVSVNYRFLSNRDGSDMSQIKVIEELVRCGQRQLLIHPLIESLLYLKWKNILPVVYTILAIYGVFLISFNAFVVTIIYREDSKNVIKDGRNLNSTGAVCFECFEWWSWLLITLIYFSCYLLFVQECFYIYLQRHRYFVNLESWIKLNLLSLGAVVPIALGMYCSPPNWLRHLTCAVLLLSWLQAMLFLSRFPDWGYYVLMFERVSYNIFKILLTSVCLIIGFSLSFMIEYQSVSPFDGPGNSFVKTLIMMTSEFDYEDLFGKEHARELQNTKTAVQLIFVVFVVFVALILINFIIGVAVSNINDLNIRGNIRRLEKQVELQSTLGVLIYSIKKLIKFGRRHWYDTPTANSARFRFPCSNYYLSIFKDLECNIPWLVLVEESEWEFCRDIYYQSLNKELENAIIDIARNKTEKKKVDHKNNLKKKQLQAIYNSVTGMSDKSLELNCDEKDKDSPVASLCMKIHEIEHSITDTKQTIKENSNTILELEHSITHMKQTINDLKESSNKILELLINSRNPTEN